MRTTRNKLIVATAATALVFGGAGIGVAQASNNHDDGAGNSSARAGVAHAGKIAHAAKVAKSDKGEDKGEGRATGRVAQHARAAALTLLPGGKVNSVERDNENGATWEVEVTKTDGTTVDVRLDARFKLVVIEGDSEANDGVDDADDE